MDSQKKSVRLKPVQELADREEQEQAARYVAIQQQHAHQQQKLEELQQYYTDYSCAAAEHRGDVKSLQESREFLARLAVAIRQQSDNVKRCANQLDDIQQQWLSARRHSKSMAQLVERYRGVERREKDRREQRDNDEIINQRRCWDRRRQ